MLKKVFCLIFSAVLVLSVLAGCAPKEETPPETTVDIMANALYKEDPADDGVFQMLMIGNSGCTYFIDELDGMFEAAGINADVYALYYSGCDVQRHWNWLGDHSPNYELHHAGAATKNSYTLANALKEQNWDVISLQQAFWPEMTDNLPYATDSTLPFAKGLYDHIKSVFPLSDLYWHETWAYQVGFNWRGTTPLDQVAENMKVLSVEKQTAMYEVIRTVSQGGCEENGVPMVPVADAWQIARANPLIGDTLCNRLSDGGDNLHDGDIGGGQFLNASVWFETLSGKSCLDNTFRPSKYPLDEEKVAALQQAAHQAVEALK